MKTYLPLNCRWPLIAATFLTFTLLSPLPPTHAQSYNEDEWYDPSDWFDGNNYEYDDASGRGADDYDYDWGYSGYPAYSSGTPDYATRYWRDTYDYDRSTADQDQQRQQTTATNRQDQPSQRAQSQQAQQTPRTAQDQSDQPRIFAGYIDGFREVNVRDRQGARDRFTVVRLRLRDGSTANVDLGQRLALGDLNLEKGDYLRAHGQQRTISGQQVILADKILADGREHRISRSGSGATGGQQQASQSAQPSRSPQSRPSAEASQENPSAQSGRASSSLRGTVESFRRVAVEGSKNGHTLVRVTMENGSSQIVDLGPNQTARTLGISPGDYVSIRGRETQLNDRPILRADQVYADGNWKTVRQVNRRDDGDQQQ